MKYLINPKICNVCKTEHNEVPDNAKRDKSYFGWHFDCSCKSTMFAPDDKLDTMHCKCDDCRDDINAEECEYDCECQGCNEKRGDMADHINDVYKEEYGEYSRD